MHPATPETYMTAPDPWAWLARISRPQGRKGEVWAEILTDFPEKFAERKLLWLIAPEGAAAKTPAGSTKPKMELPRQIELAGHWLHKGGVVLHFAGIDSITDAETLSGLIVAIPQEERAPLGDDEMYIGDMIGCTVFDVAQPDKPVAVGEIEEVDRSTGPVAMLILRGASGEVLIPFAKSFLRKIDVAARRIEMALPEGLVDLNPPPGKMLKVTEE
jgi:16S rRNA processing protein RimM